MARSGLPTWSCGWSRASEDPARFMRSVYMGEVMKILITVALFDSAIRIMRPQFLSMMVGYAVTFLVYWVALGTGYPWFATDSDGKQPR